VTQRLRVAFMVFMALPIPKSHIIQPSTKTGNRFKAKKLAEKGVQTKVGQQQINKVKSRFNSIEASNY